MKVWDLAQGSSRELTGHGNWILDVAWSPSGTHLASAGADGTARLWDAKTLACLGTLEGQHVILPKVVFSPDGHRVATGGYRTVWVWDVGSKSVIQKLQGLDPCPTAWRSVPGGGGCWQSPTAASWWCGTRCRCAPADSSPARTSGPRSSRRRTQTPNPSRRLP